jgi:site-specific recombinase XerD
MSVDPFANRKYHLDEVDLAYLTEEELKILTDKEISILRLQMVKDIYLFSCYTGLAYIDVKQLTYENIIEKNGFQWIQKKRQKTKNLCSIPILPPALSIMKKYKNSSLCEPKNLVLPVLSNQKMNAYLKEIADICGIQKKLSTHTARHTFATTTTLGNEVSLEVVSKMLGHTDQKMTRRYARVNEALIEKGMSKIFEIYK